MSNDRKHVNIALTLAEERAIRIIGDKYEKAGLPTHGLQSKIIHDGLAMAIKHYNALADRYAETAETT